MSHIKSPKYYKNAPGTDVDKSLRRVILKIAGSYVGQQTYEITKKREGFHDEKFEEKMKKVGWFSGAHYCNTFVRLVYKEAMFGGNLKFNPSNPSVNGKTINWKNNIQYLPKKADRTTLQRKKYGLLSPYVPQSAFNHALLGRYVQVSGKQSELDRLTKNVIKPGDTILFDWQGDGKLRGDSPRVEDHIGLYIANLGGGQIMTIEGNTQGTRKDGKKVNGVWLKHRKISTVWGFTQLTYEALSDSFFQNIPQT